MYNKESENSEIEDFSSEEDGFSPNHIIIQKFDVPMDSFTINDFQ